MQLGKTTLATVDWNDKVVIARAVSLYNIVNVFLVSHILLLFDSPKGSWKKLQNMRNSENISHVVLNAV